MWLEPVPSYRTKLIGDSWLILGISLQAGCMDWIAVVAIGTSSNIAIDGFPRASLLKNGD